MRINISDPTKLLLRKTHNTVGKINPFSFRYIIEYIILLKK